MSGRITYRHEQPARAALVEIPPLSTATLTALEKELGRGLTEAERTHIAEMVEVAQFWRDRARVSTATEDCRATLAALATEPDATVLAAYDACDVSTRAYLWTALCVDLALTGRALLIPTPAALKSAALLALESVKAQRGPRRTHLRLLAGDAAALWRRLGGTECSASARDSYATPLVRFAAALFEASGNPRSLPAIAKLLRDESRPGK